MSQTFSLVCKETKRSIWIGQGHGVMSVFYSGMPETMERLKRFLNAHAGKQLEFVCNDRTGFITDDGWEEFENPERE